jgi:probable rRNA maturation factor
MVKARPRLKVSVIEEGASTATAKGLGAWLARAAPRVARGSVTVAVVPDAKVKALNKQYRGIDKATDVLSFPSQIGVRGKGPRPLPLAPHLGDIVIARGVARRQAKNLGHSVPTELRILALHGLLHLLGYDHETDNGRMAKVEARLRRRARLPHTLIARSSS